MDETDATPDSVLQQALRSLQELLGAGWEITALPGPETPRAEDGVIDSRVQVLPPDGQRFAELLVIARTALTPRDVETELRRISNVLRHARSHQTLLVTSPWISARTQQALQEHEISYLDLTGNASIAINHPSIRIKTHGASRPPKSLTANESPSPRTVTLAGVRAGRVVRFLIDRRPPYRAGQIADATDVSLPWVSRLLGQLEDQLLIRRTGRMITEVRWPEILRARAETYDLLRHNSYVSTVAINGQDAVLAQLAKAVHTATEQPRIAVTGSYATKRFAPYIVGGRLMIYVDPGPHTPDLWADRLDLMQADGGDVLFLRAYDQVVFEGTSNTRGVPYVALSQLALDSLAGPDRLPAEGERLLEYMIDHENEWRMPFDRG
ncbi:hypothetical protein AB0A63_16745 [Lentzea sp. NPDC042327]|uniref:hypothetical protein n=1 Tax=Lentzea sp. NPDC042327 TaxID=3154801 RepID=UPI0033CFE272